MAQLVDAEDPAALVQSWETPDNCESPGYGRVRIDNVRKKPEDAE